MARFCTSGTCSRASSTPRSPRATMIAVERLDDLREVLDRLGFLHLRDDGDRGALPSHDVADQLGVLRRADERQGDEVHAQAQGPPQVLRVLAGQAGTLTATPGQVEPLVVRHLAAGDDLAEPIGPSTR